jgi:hypothetical protein
MHPRQVVVLHEVLGDELVVRGDLVLAAAAGDPPVELVGGESGRQVAELVGERAGPGVEADEHEETPAVHRDLEQAVVGPVEGPGSGGVEDPLLAGGNVGALEQGGAQAGAVQVVGPAVVRAPDPVVPPDVAGIGIEQRGGPVSAHVVEGA